MPPPIIIHGTPEGITLTIGEEVLKIPPHEGKKFTHVLVNDEDEHKTIELTKAWEIKIE